MTATPTTPAHPTATLDGALERLRARGLRVSSARRMVLEALFLSSGPVTAEEIAGGLDGRLPASDLGSVYRNLEVLERVGLVRHVHLGHGPGLYRRAGATDPLVVCESCGSALVLDGELVKRLSKVVREASGIDVRFDHFPLVGTCVRCADGSLERRFPCTSRMGS